MQEVVELEQLLQELAAGSADERAKFSRITGIKLESENITARVLRKLVAKTAGLSETNVARLKHINSSLQPELKEVLEEGKIGISAADELARMAPEEQQEAAKQIKKARKFSCLKENYRDDKESQSGAKGSVRFGHGRAVARANEYGRIYSNARTSKCV